MGSLNKCMFIGRVGGDPDVKTINNTKNVRFSLAISEKYKDRNGESHENTEWVNIVGWRNVADVVERFVKKGMEIYVEGKMTTREYTDANGVKRKNTDIEAERIQLLGTRQVSGEDGSGNNQQARQSRQAYGDGNGAGYGRGQQRQSVSTPTQSDEYEPHNDDLPF